MRARALYYRILEYQPPAAALMKESFDIIECDDPRQDDDATLASIDVLFAPLGFMVDAAKMARCPNLKAIVSNTTGVPHIDMVEAARRNIAVCALHDEQAFLDTITPTAEHTIGLMLAAWRRIPAAHAAAAGGAWSRWPWAAPRMFSRMRLGLVGYGRLGSKVGRIAEAMDMEVAWYDPFVDGSVSDLTTLARRSDVLSLHAPALDSTRLLVSRAILEALPAGALVINTARGELLDTEALLDLLEGGHIASAALDTIDGEFDPDFTKTFGASRLATYARNHDNLVLTPHIGGSTMDAWSETQSYVVRKAIRSLTQRGVAI